MNYTFEQLEKSISKFVITEENYYIYEELLKQPYQIFRPIIDMLIENLISIEDLAVDEPNDTMLTDYFNSKNDKDKYKDELKSDYLINKCIQLIQGKTPSSVLIQRDMSGLMVNELGIPTAQYVPEILSLVSTDSNSISPNQLEIIKSGSIQNAQKKIQDEFGGILQPDIK
jgi:Cdc6-like AAA superfamily ATPase